MTRALLFLLSVLTGLASFGAQAAPTSADRVGETNAPVVRVNVTNQPYDFFRPWSKKPPTSKRGLGILIRPDRILVTAQLVADATYLEFERAGSGEKTAAVVDVVDYEANLALLKPVQPDFLHDLQPIGLTLAKVGDSVTIWQLEPTGAILKTSALLTTVEITTYPSDNIALLVYRMTSSLQYRDGSFVLPAIKDGKLVGMLMRYDPRSQNLDVIPAPVIEHFLKAAEGATYKGFPRAGIQFSPMRDPQLRRHAGLGEDEKDQGVYITEVSEDGSGEKAGLEPGDVLLSVDGIPVDQDGNYPDPDFGKVSIAHLVTTRHQTGDVLKTGIMRDKQRQMLDVALLYRPPAMENVPPYVIDTPPDYYILGGLVLQELTGQYLREWGNEWQNQAPQRLVYYARYFDEVFGEGRGKLVLLSQVLPSSDTIGYEQLRYLLLTKINDREIHGLDDVAAAVKHPIDGFHKIEFSDDPKVIYLDAKEIEANAPTLQKNYGLPGLRSGLDVPAGR